MPDKGTFFIGFCYSQLPFFKRVLKRGFGHLVLAAYSNKCLFIFEKRTYLSVMEAHSVKDEKEAINILLSISHLHMLTMVTANWNKRRWIPTGWLPHIGTCLSFIKLMLGIRLSWIITPYQLFKYLKKSNKLCIIHTNEQRGVKDVT